MNKKISIILVVLFLCIFSFNTVRAQESEDISIEQEVKIENVGILPNSSWYFLKEFRRNVQKIFTFDRVKKVELQIKINDEKAEEISVLQEKDPENTVSIKKALINYLENKEKLKSNLDNLKENSENPNIESLILKVEQNSEKHLKLFDKVGNKMEQRNVELDKTEGDLKGLENELDAIGEFDFNENETNIKPGEKIFRGKAPESAKNKLDTVKPIEDTKSIEPSEIDLSAEKVLKELDSLPELELDF